MEFRIVIDFDLYLSYLISVSAIVIAPGPSTLFVALSALTQGSGKSKYVILGEVTASAILITVTAFGVFVISTTTQSVLSIFQLAGLLLISYVGIKLIASKNSQSFHLKSLSRAKLFISSFWISLTNPVAIIFFTGLQIQFIDQSLPFRSQALTLGITFIICNIISLKAYEWVAIKFGVNFLKDNIGKLNLIAGLSLLTISLFMGIRILGG